MKALIIFTLLLSWSAAALNRPALSHSPFSQNSSMKKASFDETYERYPTPYAVLQQFRRIVPNLPEIPDSACLQIDESSAPVIGTMDPQQGAALEKEPGALFYQYYQDCVRTLVNVGFSDITRATDNSKMILGPALHDRLMANYKQRCLDHEAYLLCYDQDSMIPMSLWNLSAWVSVPPEFRKQFLSRLVDYLIGPDAVLRHMRYMGNQTVFGEALPDRDSLIAFLLQKISELETQMVQQSTPKILKVADVYAEISILLRLGPALKQ